MSSYREVPIIAKRIISGSTAHPEPHLIREVDVINLNWGNLVLIGNDVYAYSGTLGDNTHEFELVGPWEGGGGEVQDEVDVMEETLQGEGGGEGDFELLLPTIPPGDECFGLDLAHYASLPGQDFIVGGVEEDRAIGEGSEGEGGGVERRWRLGFQDLRRCQWTSHLMRLWRILADGTVTIIYQG